MPESHSRQDFVDWEERMKTGVLRFEFERVENMKLRCAELIVLGRVSNRERSE